MPKPLSREVEENIFSMLHRGCSLREIARSLHVSVGAVHNLCQLHLLNANCSCEGRPRIMSRAKERTYVPEMVRGRVGTYADATRHVNQALGMQVSCQTIMRTFVRVGLHSQKKVKKPHLSAKNVKACLEFAKIHQHWTMEDWSRVVFSDESKINRFCSDGMTWCWTRNIGELSSKTIN